MSEPRPPFRIGGHAIAAGRRVTVDLPVSVLSDHTPVHLSAHVVHGRKPGPAMFVSAAVHGDEILGVEIVRRLLRSRGLDALRGTLVAVPIVNSFGFLNHSRYLPDRRDLNRCFPGSEQGSLAGRLAHLFLNEVVYRCDFGIDLHSAAIHRTNLPQIRVSPGAPRLTALARAFGAPVILTAREREGSLRKAAAERGVDVLLYEAGEGLRFDEMAIRAGLSGILRTMVELDMIAARGVQKAKVAPLRSKASKWLRAPAGGIFRAFKATGDTIVCGDVVGAIADPFGDTEVEIVSQAAGIVIGRTNLPVVNEGDALFHVAGIEGGTAAAEGRVGALEAQLSEDPLFDEDEII